MISLKPSFLFFTTWFFLSANAQNKDSVNVVQATENFLNAFNNFNWPVFRQSFDDNATIFYPQWDLARRKSGRIEIEKAWLELFPEFSDNRNTAKMTISPKDVVVQLYGETAIVSFHLGDGVAALSRRTLVFVKIKGVWKIAHLHASNIVAGKN